LDCRLVEFCNRLPPNLKLRGLTEKFLLKQVGRKWLPPEIWQRPKRPYRAPIHRSFFAASGCDYLGEMLSPEALRRTDLFKPQAVNQLVQKIRQGLPASETEDMALAGILSTQLVHHHFVENFKVASPLSEGDPVKVRLGTAVAPGG